MRFVAIGLASTSFVALAACGGGGDGAGVQGLGSVAPPASTTPTTSTLTPTTGTQTPTPTPTPTASTPTPTPTSAVPTIPPVNVGTLTPTPISTSTNLLDITAATDFAVVGGLQTLSVAGAGGSLYRGNASTVSNTASKINYSPRDGVFTLTLNDTAAGLNRTVRYQDPAHRTDSPERSIPQLTGFNYVSAYEDNNDSTFFYQRPGTTGVQYVSLGGFGRTTIDAATGDRMTEQAAFAFGQRTASLQVPISGMGTYRGDFLATMVGTKYNEGARVSAFQWLVGASTINVNFGSSTVGLALNGKVLDAAIKNDPISNTSLNIPGGSTFTAEGSAKIDLLRTGGFTGSFSSAAFTINGRAVPVDFAGVNPDSNVAGASSIDGAFYGPNAVNIGGSFRIIGGTPDQRVDVLGAFNGAK